MKWATWWFLWQVSKRPAIEIIKTAPDFATEFVYQELWGKSKIDYIIYSSASLSLTARQTFVWESYVIGWVTKYRVTDILFS